MEIPGGVNDSDVRIGAKTSNFFMPKKTLKGSLTTGQTEVDYIVTRACEGLMFRWVMSVDLVCRRLADLATRVSAQTCAAARSNPSRRNGTHRSRAEVHNVVSLVTTDAPPGLCLNMA